jgi:TonB family protein
MRSTRRWFPSPWIRALPTAALAWAVGACAQGGEDGGVRWQGVPNQPDTIPVMRNAEPPFRYPAALYAQKVQGNVTLRLYVDERGMVLPESTKVHEMSGYAALDSAAVDGARSLRFTPAKDGGKPIPVSILFPVYFRHPQGLPLTGDTVLQGRSPAPVPPQ